jgi:hypothetical protein
MSLKLINPVNGARKNTLPFLWTLLFGGFYFIANGMWGQSVIALFVSVITFGIGWLVYPFVAKSMVRRHYLKLGWLEVDEYNRRLGNGSAPISWVGANKPENQPVTLPRHEGGIKIRCRNCSSLNDEEANFCRNCGKSLR